MSTEIKCPQCGHEFEPTDSIREEVQRELRNKMTEWQKQQQQKFEQQLQDEKKRTQAETEEFIRRSVTADFENKLSLLQQSQKDNEEKLKLSRERELGFLKKQQELQQKEQELDLQLQKMLLEERNKLSDVIRKEEAERNSLKETEYQMRLKEMEKQLDVQKKLAEEMRRKAEQGSMQLQGEVQELALEEMLKAAFPFDEIKQVGKGVRGADCIQHVRNNFGQDCGQIIYESKRTNSFTAEWIEKLKADMRSLGAEIAVIVTKTMPKEMDCFGIKDGVWICAYSEVKALASVLRDGVIRVFNAAKSQENRGDKMHLLYDYLTSREFGEQWQAIREGFMSMKLSIQRERDAMEKLWKQREKQLEKILLSSSHVKGSIDGISGAAIDLNLLGDPMSENEE